MSKNPLKKMTLIQKAVLAGMLIFCFGLLSGFAPYLHAHDFDLTEVDEDCIPCQWAQNHVGLDQDFSSFDYIPLCFTQERVETTQPKQNFKYIFFGLSPPLFS